MFLDVRFPCGISSGSTAGPERKTEIVVLGSGYEERNSRWADSRRVYNAGYGVKDIDQLNQVIEFFEETRGKLYGFRWKDDTDYKSCLPLQTVTALDQNIGTGNGSNLNFQLIKSYGSAGNYWIRTITKPVEDTVLVAVNGVVKVQGTHFTVDTTTGVVSFLPGNAPPNASVVTAGYEFDVPVRFDTDKLEINVGLFKHGSIPSIPIVELKSKANTEVSVPLDTYWYSTSW